MAGFIIATNLLLIVVCKLSSAQDSTLKFYATISENRPPGYYIGNVAAGSNVLQNATDQEKQAVRFSPLQIDAVNNKYFVINDVSGNLTTSSTNIDREKVCEFLEICVLELDIAVKSGRFFAIVTAKITILDENDNAPTFSNIVNTLNISEDESVGAKFPVASAFDADVSENNTIKGYNIEQSTSLFSLIATKGNDKSYSFSLKLLQELDREVTDSYTVKLIVTDGGNPVRKGTLEIKINVLDENDNSPIFLSDRYVKTIDETIAINTTILTLSATDLDIGANSELSYRFRERQSNIDTIRRLFRLNSSTGELSVISDLTREPPEFYEFFVEATDHGTIPRVNQTMVTITVNDVENNPPTIEVNLLSPGNIASVDIEENQPTEVFVAHVNVEDYDKGDNGKFNCQIEDTLFKLEKFQGRGFKVVVDGVLDREEQDIHNVTVVCEDLGQPPKTSSVMFLVRVLDVNDNDPVFEKGIYTATLEENSIPSKPLLQVNATDRDIGLNGTVEYILFDKTGEFRINNVTGEIYANKMFDREREGLVVFRVLAVDHGPIRRTGTTSVSVTLIDVNDNAPALVPTRPEFRISENLPVNTIVGWLKGEDKDSGINALFDFSFATVQATFPFTLSPNGEIKTKEELDRELQSRYEIPVTVTDRGVNKLSNTQYVTIYVTDENDNAPRVTFPNDSNDTVYFMYPVDTYNVVTTVAAYDTDDGENGSLSYAIVGGNEMNLFEIDSELGEISIKKFIDIKEDLTVSLTIEVRDKAAVPKSTRVTLNIKLLYTNSTDPLPIVDNIGNKYVIISVVVIVTTVAVAVAIIGVILFLRSVDNKKAREDVCARYSDSGISSNSGSVPSEEESSGDGKSKKKKEVSFSLEFSLHGLDGGHNEESSTDMYDIPPATVPHGPPLYTVQNQERIDTQMKALKLQQYLWESKSRKWEEHSPVHQLPVGDSESETSRETITCDSGRGGSEDDVSVSSPLPEDKRFFGLQDSKQKHVQIHPQHKYPSLPTVRESTPVQYSHPPPRPYRPADLDLKTNNINKNNNPRLALKTFQNPTYSLHNAQSEFTNQRHSVHNTDPWRYLHQQNGGKFYPRVRHDSGSSLRSNEDDGGSTTTSGSYTLDVNDIDIGDTYPVSRDLVV